MGTDPQPDVIGETLPLFDAGGEEEFDPWPLWAASNLPAHPKVTIEKLQKELAKLLKAGLPVTMKNAGTVLPHLRSVVARSVHPYDPVSRVTSLNRLLVRVLAEMGEEDFGPAARILFAVAKSTKGTLLTLRRENAARVLSYEATHFRKQIEPKILEEIAIALYQDLLRYKRRVRRAPLAEEPTGDTPRMTVDDFTHQEELVSRIWQHVYGWRAELIAVGRLEGQPGYESQAEDHRQAAIREELRLRESIGVYAEIYGERFVAHGDAEFSLETLTSLTINR